MALETLKGLTRIGSTFAMTNEERPKNEDGSVNWDSFDEMRKVYGVCVDHKANMISFKIQDGPIKEVGLNGCQLTDMVEVSLEMLKKLNEKFPCRENSMTITKLEEALMWQEKRTKDREARNVEGKSLC
jgi:hypothetical protein